MKCPRRRRRDSSHSRRGHDSSSNLFEPFLLSPSVFVCEQVSRYRLLVCCYYKTVIFENLFFIMFVSLSLSMVQTCESMKERP